jgi:hypothetical protein
MGGGIAVKFSGKEGQQASHADGGDQIQALMFISAACSSPHGHVDFDVLRSRLKGMAASITHEIAKLIKGADFLLHGSSFNG